MKTILKLLVVGLILSITSCRSTRPQIIFIGYNEPKVIHDTVYLDCFESGNIEAGMNTMQNNNTGSVCTSFGYTDTTYIGEKLREHNVTPMWLDTIFLKLPYKGEFRGNMNTTIGHEGNFREGNITYTTYPPTLGTEIITPDWIMIGMESIKMNDLIIKHYEPLTDHEIDSLQQARYNEETNRRLNDMQRNGNVYYLTLP